MDSSRRRTATPRFPGAPGRLLVAVLAVAVALVPSGLAAQAPPEVPAGPVRDPAASEGSSVSPGGAFLRAVLVPGWGHASIGSYGRGGFYFAVEGITAWGLFKTRRRLEEARERAGFRESLLRQRAAEEGLSGQALVDFLEEDAVLQDLGGLVNAREQQREDWLAFGVFVLFLSGADAYVSAHLKDFPTPLEVNAAPVGAGRMEISVGIRLPN